MTFLFPSQNSAGEGTASVVDTQPKLEASQGAEGGHLCLLASSSVMRQAHNRSGVQISLNQKASPIPAEAVPIS